MKTTLIIVTDLGMVKAYELSSTIRGTPHLELIETVVLEEGHQKLAERVSDLAGRRGGPTNNKGGAPMADDHNMREEIKRRLIKQIAGHITRLAQSHPESRCWLAATKEINNPILEALPRPIGDRIESNVVRDLTRSDEPVILESFAVQSPAAR